MARIPLVIPSGWIVHYHELYNEEPLLSDGTENPNFNDSEDLIWMECKDYYSMLLNSLETILINDKDITPSIHQSAQEIMSVFREKASSTINIDVGWYGGNAKNGKYRLVIYRKNWDEVIHSFECMSTYELNEHINDCLENMNKFLR